MPMTDFTGCKRVDKVANELFHEGTVVPSVIYNHLYLPVDSTSWSQKHQKTSVITASRGCGNKTFAKGHRVKMCEELICSICVPSSLLNHCSMTPVCFSRYIRFMVGRPSLSVRAAVSWSPKWCPQIAYFALSTARYLKTFSFERLINRPKLRTPPNVFYEM